MASRFGPCRSSLSPYPNALLDLQVDSFDSPSFKEVCKAPMTAAHLEAKHCFVLNTGKVVYVWLGSSLDPSARARSTEIGTHFVSAHGEKSAQVKVVKSGLEPPIFKQHFPDWTKWVSHEFELDREGGEERDRKLEGWGGRGHWGDEANRPGRLRRVLMHLLMWCGRVMSTAVPAPPVAQPSVPQQDLEALITGSGHGQDKDQVAAEAEAASAGKLTIWLVRNFELMEWPESRYGEFFAADSFVVLNSYELSGAHHEGPFWVLLGYFLLKCSMDGGA